MGHQSNQTRFAIPRKNGFIDRHGNMLCSIHRIGQMFAEKVTTGFTESKISSRSLGHHSWVSHSSSVSQTTLRKETKVNENAVNFDKRPPGSLRWLCLQALCLPQGLPDQFQILQNFCFIKGTNNQHVQNKIKKDTFPSVQDLQQHQGTRDQLQLLLWNQRLFHESPSRRGHLTK